uniref:Large ribosomal subunit protein bL21m n=1 Tax=Helianthus annuus TaxID=4232 RepID=A0A251TK85_HELAN
MANRRCIQALTQCLYKSNLHSKPPPFLHHLKTLSQVPSFPPKPLQSHHIFSNPNFNSSLTNFTTYRHFSSDRHHNSDESEEDDDDDDDDETVTNPAAAISYKVIGRLQRSDRVFKAYESVFAVIQIGAHQFKVSDGDCIYAEKLKFCEVNDKIILNKVLMLGSKTQTMYCLRQLFMQL